MSLQYAVEEIRVFGIMFFLVPGCWKSPKPLSDKNDRPPVGSFLFSGKLIFAKPDIGPGVLQVAVQRAIPTLILISRLEDKLPQAVVDGELIFFQVSKNNWCHYARHDQE